MKEQMKEQMKQVILVLLVFVCNQLVFAETPNKQNEFWKQSYIPSMDYAKMNALKKEKPSIEKAQGYLAKTQQLGFKENKGQMADANGKPTPFVLFKAEAPNLNIWVTTTGLTYQFFKIEEDHEERGGTEKTKKENEAKDNIQGTAYNIQEGHERMTGEWHRVDMILKNSTIKKENIITENNITQGAENYYLGHCSDGIFNVKTYTKITIKEIYKGIDWVLYTANGGLKHDFIVHPQADLKQIKLLYEGSGEFEVKNNQIHFKNEIGELTEGKLLCYQGTESNEVKANYEVVKNKMAQYLGAGNISNETERLTEQTTNKNNELFSYELSIAFNNYNINKTLVIDPQLVWATYYGGSYSDISKSITTDRNDNIYITGSVQNIGFPTQNLLGAYNQAIYGGGNFDAFILKFNSIGVLLWATNYGGTDPDIATSITTDGNNNVFVTGYTYGSNFPTQLLVGSYNQSINAGQSDMFILHFSNTGNRLWATLYGGSTAEFPTTVTTDINNNIYIVGETNSNDFPLQNLTSAYNQSLNSGITDAFILKFNTFGSCIWATYFGGSGNDIANGLSVDNNLGFIYITGETQSSNFPIQNLTGTYNQSNLLGIDDVFILKFTITGNLLWSTYFGGNNYDIAMSLAVDKNSNLYVMGLTSSLNLPTQNLANAYNQGVFGGGSNDCFLLKFNSNSNYIWGTYIGGNDFEAVFDYDFMAIDSCNNLFISLSTFSNNFPLESNMNCNYMNSTFDNTYKANCIMSFNEFNTLTWSTFFSIGGAVSLVCNSQNELLLTGDARVNHNTFVNPNNGAYFSTNGANNPMLITKFKNNPTYSIQDIPADCNCPNLGALTVSVTCGSPPYSYYWSNGFSVINSTLSVCTNSNISYGTHTVTIVSGCSTFTLSHSLICIADAPKISNVKYTISNPICPNTIGSINISSITQNTDIGTTIVNNFTITEGGSVVATNNSFPFTINNLSIGSHTFSISNGSNCNYDFVVDITSIPSFSLTAENTQTIFLGETTILYANILANTTYTWLPSSTLSCSNCLNPIASPTVTTIYTITATDANGCFATSTVQIVVKERCGDENAIYLPNAFSPNGDGQNDVFCIQDGQSCINSISLIIYNRWGEKVFETSNPAFCWDGTYKGKLQDPTVFIYVAKAIFTNGQTTDKKGNITLIQ